jgi:hypothetical protein
MSSTTPRLTELATQLAAFLGSESARADEIGPTTQNNTMDIDPDDFLFDDAIYHAAFTTVLEGVEHVERWIAVEKTRLLLLLKVLRTRIPVPLIHGQRTKSRMEDTFDR